MAPTSQWASVTSGPRVHVPPVSHVVFTASRLRLILPRRRHARDVIPPCVRQSATPVDCVATRWRQWCPLAWSDGEHVGDSSTHCRWWPTSTTTTLTDKKPTRQGCTLLPSATHLTRCQEFARCPPERPSYDTNLPGKPTSSGAGPHTPPSIPWWVRAWRCSQRFRVCMPTPS